MKLLLSLLMLLISTPIWATDSLDGFIIQPAQKPASWGTPYSVYAVSINAPLFFENYESIYFNQLKKKLVAKKFQSFAGPGGKGTVFYMEFEPGTQMKNIEDFAKKLIWQASQPTNGAPEKIFSIGTKLVIISFADPLMTSQVEQLIRSNK